MAILFEKQTEESSILIYQILESEDFYYQGIDFTDFDKREFESISNPLKKSQWLASRYWLKKMTGEYRQLYLEKTSLGKPQFANTHFQFSISHSLDKIAIILSPHRTVAIDIESISDKVLRVKNKFLHPNDVSEENNLVILSLIWSAKETIYKLYHDKSLYSFKEQIVITQIDDCHISYQLFDNRVGKVNYVLFDSFVLTWMTQI